MDVHELVPREIAGMSYIISRFFSCGEKMRRLVWLKGEGGDPKLRAPFAVWNKVR